MFEDEKTSGFGVGSLLLVEKSFKKCRATFSEPLANPPWCTTPPPTPSQSGDGFRVHEGGRHNEDEERRKKILEQDEKDWMMIMRSYIEYRNMN